MKTRLLLSILGLFLTISAMADCTVTTACNSYSFPNETNLSVSSRSVSNGFLITISNSDGTVLAQETCSSGGISTRCTSSGSGSFDICDLNLPARFKARFGCTN